MWGQGQEEYTSHDSSKYKYEWMLLLSHHTVHELLIKKFLQKIMLLKNCQALMVFGKQFMPESFILNWE